MPKKINEHKMSQALSLELCGCAVSFTRGEAKRQTDAHWIVKPPSWFTPGTLVLCSCWKPSLERQIGIIVEIKRMREDSSLQIKYVETPSDAVVAVDFYAQVLINGAIELITLKRMKPHEFS